MWPTLVTDPAYTFFSLSDEPPCGAARVYLTGGHSIAVDPTRLPMGMAALFAAARPAPPSPRRGAEMSPQGSGDMSLQRSGDMSLQRSADIQFSRFALAQDTGSAIQGSHVDVYWGTGDYAQLASDTMNSQGMLFIMKLK